MKTITHFSSQIKAHQKFWMDSVLHLHYSLDAIQSDYSMFGPLKKSLKKQNYTNEEALRNSACLRLQRESKFFWAAIHALLQRWKIPW
jgi:hypothetical protein